jgi:hypothetical protein
VIKFGGTFVARSMMNKKERLKSVVNWTKALDSLIILCNRILNIMDNELHKIREVYSKIKQIRFNCNLQLIVIDCLYLNN